MQSMKADLRNDITRDRNDSREYYLSVCFIIQSYASHDNKESFKYLELSLIQLYGMEKRTDEDKKYIADMVSSILVKMAVNNFRISESQRSKVSSLIYKTGLPDYLELLDALSAITVHDKGH